MCIPEKLKYFLVLSLIILLLTACGESEPQENDANQPTDAPTSTPVEEIANTSTPTIPPVPTPTFTQEPLPTPVPYPGKRGFFHRMVYDSESDLIFLYGGEKNEMGDYEECWTYDTDLNLWSILDVKCSNEVAIAYDSGSDRIIIYKGLSYKTWKLTGATYSFDLNTTTRENPKPENIPFGYAGAQLAYDSESDQTILFGGIDLSMNFFNDTYAFHLGSNTWQQQNPAIVPPGRVYHFMAYHPTLDRVIMFGGTLAMGEEGADVTWLYDYNTDTWSTVNTEVTPVARSNSAMVYVSSLDQVLMFGGMSSEGVLNDTWAFDHVNNTWIELSPESAPTARGWHAMAYDSANDKVILFGGGEAEYTFSNETWIYDPQANTWTNVTP